MRKSDNLKDLLQVKNSTDTSADLYFYGDIVSSWWDSWEDADQYPDAIKNFLNDHKGKDLNIYINSGGGSVFAGIAIYNMLKRHDGNKTVYVDGLAGSIASVIALAGDKVVIPHSAYLMIHKPWSWCAGNANDFTKMASDLDAIEKGILNIYEENLVDGVSMDTIKQLVNDETWLDGNEASKYFNIEIGQERTVLACASDLFESYNKVPSKFKSTKNEHKHASLGQEQQQLLNELDLI